MYGMYLHVYACICMYLYMYGCDWMHETARCFGYPSDSTRAARERAREATCEHCLRRFGPVRPGRASSTTQVTPRRPKPLWLFSSLRRLSPLWLNSSLRHLSPPWLNSSLLRLSPLWLNSGRRRALPTSQWPWVSSRAAAGVLDRRPVSPLSSTSACSGAGSG
jgi:hypothetical protein